MKTEAKALIIVDVQEDFLPGGALAVPGGEEIVPLINSISGGFDRVVATQDWHPPGHVSFASASGKKPYSRVRDNGRERYRWPDHCVQGSPGAELSRDLDTRPVDLILRKGTDPALDSYSAFLEEDRKTDTGLRHFLKGLGLKEVYVCGLALDYCVLATALDAAALGFRSHVIQAACRAVDKPRGSAADALEELRAAGVKILGGEPALRRRRAR